uniref:Protein COFACTOR ASSEMBLY OF COMPLEX C SUBUNIT B CCB4, chloroplastic n=1 Tax=Chenopodium quinoa TaxID=63459 RepID=A0A803MBR5_CHEQI
MALQGNQQGGPSQEPKEVDEEAKKPISLEDGASAENSTTTSEGFKGPKPSRNLVADWVSNNDNVARSLPIYVGGFSLLAVLFNRTVSGIAPVADASSSQSRADLLALGLAVTNILTGLVWLSIRPKAISKVDPEGVECRWISSSLPDSAISELEWFWQSLSAATCCRSLVVIYEESCICQIGVAAESLISGEAENVDAKKLIQGTLYRGIMKSGAQSYLANLSLYPGRSELPFLPSNTQVCDFEANLWAFEAGALWCQPAVVGATVVGGVTDCDGGSFGVCCGENACDVVAG